MITNQELGVSLGVSPSAASRLRNGERVGSIEVLQRVVELTQADGKRVIDAAVKARAGDTGSWVHLIEQAGTAGQLKLADAARSA